MRDAYEILKRKKNSFVLKKNLLSSRLHLLLKLSSEALLRLLPTDDPKLQNRKCTRKMKFRQERVKNRSGSCYLAARAISGAKVVLHIC